MVTDRRDRSRTLVVKASDPHATLAERHEAFGELVRAFQDMAYACAVAVLHDFHLAEDAAQEAFHAAWQRLHQLRQPEAFPGWFRRIVLTECHRLRRGKRVRTTLLDGVSVPSTLESPQAAVERGELNQAVVAAIAALPGNERMVVLLFYLEEHSQRDISAFLEVPMTTVAKRLYSARVRLKGTMMARFTDDFAAHRPSRDRSFAAKVQAGLYDDYLGRYRFEQRPELVIDLRREGDRLISEVAGQRNELMAAGESDADLRASEFDGRGEFIRDERGRVTHVIYHEFGRRMGRAEKIS